MKNAFYFTLNALFVLETINFCPDFFGHVGKRLDKKAKVNFKEINGLIRNVNFFKHHAETKTDRLVPDLFFIFRNALFEIKSSG